MPTSGFTYPVAPASIGADLNTQEIHQFLKSPTLIRRALRDITAERFIADFLLPGRFRAQGGGVFYEVGGESLYAGDAPEIVNPGAEYRRTTITGGALAAAATQKWGEQARVTDEAISRYTFDPAQRALTKLANSMVRQIDSLGLAAIASGVDETYASDPWSEADAIIESVLGVKAWGEENLNLFGDYNFDTVVLTPSQYAKVVGKLITSGYLPRESSNVVQTGVVPNYLGLTWTTSTHVPFTDPFLVDRTQLGGMADEDIATPEFGAVANGVEAATERAKGIDAYDLRVRRVTVPLITDPHAGIRITGTGV